MFKVNQHPWFHKIKLSYSVVGTSNANYLILEFGLHFLYLARKISIIVNPSSSNIVNFGIHLRKKLPNWVWDSHMCFTGTSAVTA